MMRNDNNRNIFTRTPFIILFAMTAVLLWGLAYPFIKLGLSEFQISQDDVAGKMLFAGIRFTIAGFITLAVAKFKKQNIVREAKGNVCLLLVFGLVNTGLHYLCFYVGLANCEGSKASVMNSMGTFLLIIFGSILFHERMTGNKLIGCMLGFVGILIANLGGKAMGGFRIAGEGMIIANAVCSAFGGILTRVVTKKVNTIVATGYSLATGGIMLMLGGVLSGGTIDTITAKGVMLLAGLVMISTVAFILYNTLLKYNPVADIAIFNALIPASGTLLSCLFLKEAFYLKYLISIVIIVLGIWLINKPNMNRQRDGRT
ncbi:MAG: DMT family transporter [Lachnospiraceae bacterium]|nr:DMT family transporter [Lachnospiraceae bacterium]